MTYCRTTVRPLYTNSCYSAYGNPTDSCFSSRPPCGTLYRASWGPHTMRTITVHPFGFGCSTYSYARPTYSYPVYSYNNYNDFPANLAAVFGVATIAALILGL